MAAQYNCAVNDYSTSFPGSNKVYEERTAALTPGGETITLHVPMREVTLAGDNRPIRLYDTSGPATGTRGSGTCSRTRGCCPGGR